MVIVAGHISVEPLQRESYLAGCVSVAPPSIQEHLGYSRTRVGVGCAGSMPS